MAPAVDNHTNGVTTPDQANKAAIPHPRPVRLHVDAQTQHGQQIFVTYTTSPTASLNPATATPLTYEHPDTWAVTLPSIAAPLRYKYLLHNDQDSTHRILEHGPDRHLSTDTTPYEAPAILLRDVWRAHPDSSRDIFSTAAFTRVLFRPDPVVGPKLLDARVSAAYSSALADAPGAFVAVFRVFVERLTPGDVVFITGNCPQLGNDNINNALSLADTNAPIHQVSVALPAGTRDISFRYVIKRADQVIVEDTVRRKMPLSDADGSFLKAPAGAASVVYAPSEPAFAFPTRFRAAGIALPVFSIRSRTSCGIGEFNDLLKVVDFCKATGNQLLQLLPINDTIAYNDFRDSYPYSAISSFALHPQFLNIDLLGELPNDLKSEYESERERLNAMEKIDVVDVMRVKNRFIREMFKLHRDEFLLSAEFTEWFDENQGWLVPYALFRFFILINGTVQYDQWGMRSQFDSKEMASLIDPSSFHFDHVAVVYYIQFHLHKQLTTAAEHAANNGVVFKGDLPIGVNRYCADTWVNSHLFRLHMQAGAPPDFFSKHGQNWAFPTYDWKEMSKDNYGWWRARLGHMAKYFHAYRIDHILGFFRIWEIPHRFRTGMAGRFYPSHGISRQELESLGLWDMDRYTKPYVHDEILQSMFQEDWWKIKDRFFEPLYGNRLCFKEIYDSEKKAESALELPADAPESERLYNASVTKKLFELFSNVCLWQDEEDEDMFHPRFMMQTTSSHAELPSDDWKRALCNLQEDYMNKRQDELWRKNALTRLPMMKAASDMLVCGEDLGLIPECVPSVLDETCILSLAVQRMPAADEDEFSNPSEYKYECVATTSSHDTSTFRGWWEEMDEGMRMRYWTQLMKRDGHQRPPETCTPEIVEWAVADHLACGAMWAIFPLQDLLGMDGDLRRKDAAAEQINDPSNSVHVWCFRLHIDMEKILENEAFVKKIADLNKKHNRGITY